MPRFDNNGSNGKLNWELVEKKEILSGAATTSTTFYNLSGNGIDVFQLIFVGYLNNHSNYRELHLKLNGQDSGLTIGVATDSATTNVNQVANATNLLIGNASANLPTRVSGIIDLFPNLSGRYEGYGKFGRSDANKGGVNFVRYDATAIGSISNMVLRVNYGNFYGNFELYKKI